MATILQREFFPRYGTCEVLISDGGGEFQCTAVDNLCRAAGVDHRTTMPYRPQSNSKVERFHRTLKGTLERLMTRNRSDWDSQLGPALAAYQSTATAASSLSPFQKQFGRQMRQGLTRGLQNHPDAADSLNDDRVVAMTHIWHQARDALRVEREINEQQQRKKRLSGPLQVGDTVIILIPGFKRPSSHAGMLDGQLSELDIRSTGSPTCRLAARKFYTETN